MGNPMNSFGIFPLMLPYKIFLFITKCSSEYAQAKDVELKID